MEPNFSLFGKIKWNEINMVNNFRNVYFIASWGLKLVWKIKTNFVWYLYYIYSRSIPLQGHQQNWLENSKTVSIGAHSVLFTIENWLGDEEIRKWNWITVLCRDPFIIFAGGMPRASYGDRHTVTIMQGANNIHTVLDFTSKVVDFITISRADEAEDEMGKWRKWL